MNIVDEPSKDCMLCGAPKPSSHVSVIDERSRRVGRVCASHTLSEVIRDPQERFLVDVTVECQPDDA